MKILLRAALGVVLLVGLSGCSEKKPGSAESHDHDHPHDHGHQHEHRAPHGGTVVVLGQEAYHLELVRDPAAGTLTAYVLDGEMEKFIRVGATAIELETTVAGAPRKLVLAATANAMTGETVGDTSQFTAQADWLKQTAEFDGVLAGLEIRGTRFAAVAFMFPGGKDTD